MSSRAKGPRISFNVERVFIMEELDSIRNIAEAVAKRMGFEIFDLKSYKRGRKIFINITIDNMKDYVSIKDCEAFSKEFGPLLDAEDILKNYVLEISSPGLNRPLRELKDFKRFTGRLAKIKFVGKDGKNHTVVGRINDCDEESRTFSLNVDENIQIYDFSEIKSANLEIEF